MSKSNANNPQYIVAHVGTQAATISLPVCKLNRKFMLREVSLIDQAGVVASNTNYLTITLQQGATVLATYDTRAANNGALTALVSGVFTVNATQYADESALGNAAEYLLDPANGADLKLVVTVGGTCTTTAARVQLYGYEK